MKIYFEEVIVTETGETVNYHEVNHDTRHVFWKEHPTAKEVSKKYYFEMLRLATGKTPMAAEK